jgi:hypothetical protein
MTPAAELAALLEHQKEIQNWLNLCEDRIFEMETSYLDETPGGNMIRGWDLDGRPPLRRQPEEKERIFSGSSYSTRMQVSRRALGLAPDSLQRVDSTASGVTRRRHKKKTGDYDDWGDY